MSTPDWTEALTRQFGKERPIFRVVLTLTSLVLLCCVTVSPLRAQSAAPATLIVWSEPAGSDFDVWFSQVVDEKWTAPERVALAPKFLDALPCAAPIDQGHVAVWTRFSQPGVNELVYAVRDSNGWQPVQTLKTGMTLNMASTLVRDANGVLWLGWAGFDGSDDDIYVSRWEGDGWSPRRRINRNDFEPDLLPQLALGDNGNPRIRWRSLEASGYVEMVAQYDGQNWSQESVLSVAETDSTGVKVDIDQEIRERRLESLPVVPDFVSDPGKSCMTVMDTFPIQTLRLPKPPLVPPSEG